MVCFGLAERVVRGRIGARGDPGQLIRDKAGMSDPDRSFGGESRSIAQNPRI
jgi:hypothetical protein